MITRTAPWEQEPAFTRLFKIASTESPPEYPRSISNELKDFLDSCFQIEPSDRANVYELLRHPFIQQTRMQKPLHYLSIRGKASPSKPAVSLPITNKLSSHDQSNKSERIPGSPDFAKGRQRMNPEGESSDLFNAEKQQTNQPLSESSGSSFDSWSF